MNNQNMFDYVKNIKIEPAKIENKQFWNDFIIKNYPPIGAFMASWEWGSFQQALGRKMERYILSFEGKAVAVFTLVYCDLPFGQSYGYLPRGPAIDFTFFNSEEKVTELLKVIELWAKQNISQLIFLRLEPPFSQKIKSTNPAINRPNYYIQPRHNLAINLAFKSIESILAEFHSSTRANVRKAERKNISVEIKKELSPSEWKHFLNMTKETANRNKGKNIYPPRTYFETLFKILPYINETQKNSLAYCLISGLHEGRPAAINLMLFFGGTATYLFGASYTAEFSSKLTTYLHWYSMKEFKKRGYKYYDLGGVDEKLWPSLTIFKERFGGEKFEYIGNIDVVIKPILYKTYNITRKIKKSI